MKTTIMFKTDKKLKEAAQQAAKKMGIPFSIAMNQMMRQLVKHPQLTFSAEPLKPTPYLKRILDQGEKNLAESKVKYFSSVDELFEDLNK
jgi:addiction module RelB/DinJ family antitoxin